VLDRMQCPMAMARRSPMHSSAQIASALTRNLSRSSCGSDLQSETGSRTAIRHGIAAFQASMVGGIASKGGLGLYPRESALLTDAAAKNVFHRTNERNRAPIGGRQRLDFCDPGIAGSQALRNHTDHRAGGNVGTGQPSGPGSAFWLGRISRTRNQTISGRVHTGLAVTCS